MNSLNNDFITGLLSACKPPCLSLYQLTHRHHPENQQDLIRYGNLVKALEESLRVSYPKSEIKSLLEPFLALAEDREFWNHTQDGLAVLGATGVFKVYKLHRTVTELAIVADHFHTKPLLRILQSADRFQVLGLSRQGIKLFEGNRDALEEIDLAKGVPRTLTEALGTEVTEPHLTVTSQGGLGASHSAMHHGHGGKVAEVAIDTERFFRAVDRGILEHHSRPSALPLILAGLPEHRHLFHQTSHNPFLLEEGIDIHPDALPLDELRHRAWSLIEPHYLARLAALVEEFGNARSKDLGHDDLPHVAKAVIAGKVGTLLIEGDRVIPGRLDPANGDLKFDDLAHPEVGDLLDELGTLTLKQGGQVVIVPADRMPTKTGIAAICRF